MNNNKIRSKVKNTMLDENNMKLKIELLPKTCWFVNSRYCLSFYDYNKLCNDIYEKSNYICSGCGLNTKDSKKSLQIEEKWNYDDVNEMQKLVNVIALCENCFLATHIGLAKKKGKYRESINHLKIVTKFDDEQIKTHIKEAKKTYKQRSKKYYDLDLSFLKDKGYELIVLPNKKDRQKIILDNITKEL